MNGGFLMKIIDAIPDDSLIFADITYGTKTMSVMLVYALLMVEKMKDAEVRGIYYGELVRQNRVIMNRFSYDITKLMRLFNAIESLDTLGISDKKRMIEKIFGL